MDIDTSLALFLIRVLLSRLEKPADGSVWVSFGTLGKQFETALEPESPEDV